VPKFRHIFLRKLPENRKSLKINIQVKKWTEAKKAPKKNRWKCGKNWGKTGWKSAHNRWTKYQTMLSKHSLKHTQSNRDSASCVQVEGNGKGEKHPAGSLKIQCTEKNTIQVSWIKKCRQKCLENNIIDCKRTKFNVISKFSFIKYRLKLSFGFISDYNRYFSMCIAGA